LAWHLAQASLPVKAVASAVVAGAAEVCAGETGAGVAAPDFCFVWAYVETDNAETQRSRGSAERSPGNFIAAHTTPESEEGRNEG